MGNLKIHRLIFFSLLFFGVHSILWGEAITVFFNPDNTEMDIISSIEPFNDVWHDDKGKTLYIKIINPAIVESFHYENMPVKKVDISEGVIKVTYVHKLIDYRLISNNHVKLFFALSNDENDTLVSSLEELGIRIVQDDGEWIYLESSKNHFKGWIQKKNLQALINEIVLVEVDKGKAQRKTSSSVKKENERNELVPKKTGNSAHDLLEEALKWVGTPYSVMQDGGRDKGISNTGFIKSVFSTVNIILPSRVGQQYEFSQKIDIKNMKPGDLIFFHSKIDQNTPVHVGIFMGEDQFIHCYFRDGVKVEEYNDYWKNRTYGVGRVIN